MQNRKIKRKCVGCGKYITVQLKGKKPLNAHYFGIVKVPVGKGEYIKTGKTIMIGKIEVGESRWTGKMREVEWWECEKCYEEAGKRVKERELSK